MMKPWHYVVMGLISLASLGCRTDPAIPALERQLRLKEDEVYRLRGTIDDLQDSVCDCERRIARLKHDDDRDSQRGGSSGSKPSIPGPPDVEFGGPGGTALPDTLMPRTGAPPANVPGVPEGIRSPSRSTLPGIENGAPRIEKGVPSPLDKQKGKPGGAASLDGPTLDGPPVGRGASRRTPARFASEPGAAAADSRHVAEIALDPALSGGIGDERRAGDQGVLVVVEPRDAEGRSIDAPGDLSVVVLDPAVVDRDGYAAPVARWDFTAAETAQMFRHSSEGPAIHVTALWQNKPPTHGKLHLFVRYTTADGRKLEANQPIEVSLVGARLATRPVRPASYIEEPPIQRPVWSPERR